MIQVIKPPYRTIEYGNKTVFLAGSIEMGAAEDWQAKVQSHFKVGHISFLNPRRDHWDSSWEQHINSPNFYEQVSWEMDMLHRCDVIFMYFDPNTKSPISLLELGLHADDDKLIVCCPEGFWRKGNVEIVCQRFNIPLFNSLDTALVCLKNTLDKIR